MDKWATYDQWNEAILDSVFPELEMPEPVYLDLEDEIVERLALRMGVQVDRVESALLAAVRATLPDLGPAYIFERHMVRTRRWVRGGRLGTPPFLALLAAFCLAAERMAAGEGMSTANYFGRLREVLGRDHTDHRVDNAYRRVAERLWSEHNRWLVELDGQRGLPTAFALTYRFVGLTISQALVRSGDRERFKEFFRQFGLAPGSDVPPSELALVLDSWMGQRPCPVSSSLERLWRRGQARERIAQAAAVALSAWDGSLREGPGGKPGAVGRGQLLLTMELGTFPRRRFAVQALFYLPQAGTPRDARVLTATPTADIELVPDLPGALGLGRDSAMHAGDVLGGLLQVQDSLSGQRLERRPRRLVLFREDELSRRWVEGFQVMLGDSVRLLAHESLVPRIDEVLNRIARPGWTAAEPYPGQPEDWVVYTGVEIYSSPGDLVNSKRMDDLLPLVPLTNSQLKIAGGFALPGQVRGKWHTWLPPEIRAVSDAPGGFRVRVTDLNRFGDSDEIIETLVAEWADDGSGVLVTSLADLELNDGDYRVELVGTSDEEVLSSSTVLLRSSDTPDLRQWALLDPVGYEAGVGVLGVHVDDAKPGVKGLVVNKPGPVQTLGQLPPVAPGWDVGRRSPRREVGSVVRLTLPDAESCVYTGRHRERVDTVLTDAKGKPLQAWSHGRCTGCGLVRRYPTRLPRAGFGAAPRVPGDVEGSTTRDLSGLTETVSGPQHDWSVAFDAVLHTGGGSWSHLERIALQVAATPLFVDHMARTLEVLGHIDVRRSPQTLEPTAWEVSPTTLGGSSGGYLFAGFWPSSIYVTVGQALEERGTTIAKTNPPEGPESYFADVTPQDLRPTSAFLDDMDVAVVDRAWEDVASVLPPLSQVLDALPRQSDAAAVGGSVTWYRPLENIWVPVQDISAVGAYRVRRFSTLDLFRSENDLEAGTAARSTVQLSKHLAALTVGRPLVAYDPLERALLVPLGADLPGLYGRAVVAASGTPPTPIRQRRTLRYEDVPPELARHIYDLLGR